MTRMTKSHASGLMLILCAILLLTAVPPGIVEAALIVPKLLSNDVQSFSEGAFQRSQLSTYPTPGVDTPPVSQIEDKQGAVQLMPVGLVKFKDRVVNNRLPYGLIRAGVTTVGKRIYVIGGTAIGGTNPENNNQPYDNESVNRVFSVEIDTTTTNQNALGYPTTDAWRAETSLPPVQASDDTLNLLDTPTSSVVSSPAVTSVSIGGKNYIYVIGGNTRVDPTRSFSSFAVRVGEVAAGGTVPVWKNLTDARIPSATEPTPGLPNPPQRGLQSASAVTMTVNGNAYVFLIGGLQRYVEAGSQVEAGSRAVFWAKVDPATGNLLKRDGSQGWERMTSQLPTESSNSRAGLWDAAAVAGQYIIDDTNENYVGVDKAIYVMGGQTVSNRFGGNPAPEYNSIVRQIYVDYGENNGVIDPNWIEPTLGSWVSGTLPRSRYGLGAVTFRGKHYLTGGITPDNNNAPLPDMLTTYVKDDLTFPTFGGASGANFLSDANALSSARAFHGMTLVPIGESAFVYVIGGQSNALNSPTPLYSDEIIFGKIGGQEEAETYGYAPDGWYYVKPVDFNFNNAQVQEINWATLMDETNGMDIQVSFRISLDSNCALLSSEWGAPLDANAASALLSKNGDNIFPLNNISARCFQYRARLVGGALNADGLATKTPTFRYLSVKILVPGSPDLRSDLDKEDIKAVKNAGGKLTGLQVRVRNHNSKADLTPPSFEPTLSANAEQKGGSFFVDLFIFAQGETAVKPTIPIADMSANNIGCMSIDRESMPPDAIYSISDWYIVTPNTNCRNGQRLDLLSWFQQRGPGTYTVYVVIDSTCGNGDPKGCVDETDAKAGEGEANNVVEYKFTIDTPSTGGSIVSYERSLPLMLRVSDGSSK